jgi:putative phage-type endonuclease
MYLDDLSDLEDVLDEIEPDEEEKSISSNDELEWISTCMELMFDYVNDNPYAVSEPDFEETMIENVSELLKLQNLLDDETSEEDFDEIMESALKMFYMQIMPRRSHSTTFAKTIPPKDLETISKNIEYLRSKPQPDQRTPEWYSFRHNLITASNAYKCFENETTKNQLIYEKCQPLKLELLDTEKVSQVNIKSPFHWGQKFEPVSVMYYEEKYRTKIGDFGCMKHDTYKFLGASPDGINVDPTNNRYGRLLEIKNIVNREIDGIPKKEYWIQMQLQMETCNQSDCDFLECRFSEYENEDAFLKDGSFDTTEKDNCDCKKGIILYFCNKDGNPKYIYMPFHIRTYEDFELWEKEMMAFYADSFTWIKNIYWRLDEVSCVLVERNIKWFNDNIEKIEETWRIIEKERISGAQHRAPTKRNKEKTIDNLSTSPLIDGCFLKIIKSNSIMSNTAASNTKQDIMVSSARPVLKIRTESMDETKMNM